MHSVPTEKAFETKFRKVLCHLNVAEPHDFGPKHIHILGKICNLLVSMYPIDGCQHSGFTSEQ